MATMIGRAKIAATKPLAADTYKGQVRGMVTAALSIAGFFTLPFGGLLGQWLFV